MPFRLVGQEAEVPGAAGRVPALWLREKPEPCMTWPKPRPFEPGRWSAGPSRRRTGPTRGRSSSDPCPRVWTQRSRAGRPRVRTHGPWRARPVGGQRTVRGHPDAFDLFMAGIGVCAAGDIALPVLMRVIGHRTARGWIPADGGWIPAPGVGPITAMAVVAAFDAEPRGCGTGPGRLPRDAERARPRRRGNRPSPRTPGGAPEHPCAGARDGAEPETDPTPIFSEPGGTARVSSRARPRQ